MPYANNNGVKIHYQVQGLGDPLLLLHPFCGNIDTWSQLGYAQELSKDYNLILVDARGCGKSDSHQGFSRICEKPSR